MKDTTPKQADVNQPDLETQPYEPILSKAEIQNFLNMFYDSKDPEVKEAALKGLFGDSLTQEEHDKLMSL